MGTTVKASQNPAASRGGQVVQYERFIENRLGKARGFVRLVDVLSALMTLAAAVLAYLLVLALIDHWVAGLSGLARFAALLLLLGGAGYYFVVRVLPLLLRRINPLYAARAIERSRPALKNSLISFLLFRGHREQVHQGVYRGLEAQAATGLSDVRVESAVDKSHVVRVGYVLAALVVMAAVYKIASPKDPLQTVARVILPWRDIARPARVQIRNVQPGDAQVFIGRQFDISAEIEGLDDDELATVYFSTAEGQIEDQGVSMTLPDGSLRHRCTLPPGDDGLRQDLVYRIEAGDAVAGPYRIASAAAPSVVVKEVELNYPRYTQRPREVVTNQGDVKALEGTRVTIRAVANQPIDAAYIQLHAPASADTSQADHVSVPMKSDGHKAWGSFTLTLRPDGRTPEHPGYHLTFTTPAGARNREPIRHRIEVLPDLPPLVEILAPQKRETELPLDGVQTIDVRAVDPDFALAALSLRGVVGGAEIMNESLLAQPQSGQIRKTFKLMPRELGLRVGDSLVWWAAAADNRTSATTGLDEPNTARTDNYKVRIVAAQHADAPNPDASQTPDEPEPSDQDSQQGDSQQGEGQQGEGQDGEGQQSDASDPSQGEGDGQGTPGDGPPPDEPPSGEDSSDPAGGDQNAGPSDGEPQDGESSDAAEGAGGGEQSQRPGQQRPTDGEPQPSDGDPAGEPTEPVAHDGSQDGDAFERIQEYMEQQGAEGQRSESTDPGDAGSDTDTGQQQQGTDPGQATPTDDPANQDDRTQAPHDGAADQPERVDDTGAGGRPQGGAKPEADPPGEPPEQPNERGPGTGENSPSGSGRDGGESQGAPEPQQGSRPRDKQPRPEQPNDGGPEQPQSPAIDKQQSDSQGEDPGDRRGGGESGGGQSADQPGQDSAGSNTPGDEGAGAADQSGTGQSGDQGGNDQQADDPTGSRGQEQGEGSSSRPGDADTQQPGSDPQPGPVGQGDAADGHEASPADQSGDQTGSSLPVGGGEPGDRAGSSGMPELPEGDFAGDAANEKFADEATDLVLDYLKDKQNVPDKQLLDQLGWSDDDLRQFVDRWQQMKRAAADSNQQGEQGRRELSEALRSLGLRPGTDRARQIDPATDSPLRLRDPGGASRPPSSYLEQYRAFMKSTSRVADERP